MEHSISLSSDGRYILLKVKGDITRELAMKFNIESHAIGRDHGINKYLVDMTESRNVDSVTDNYDFAYKDMRETPEVDRSARVALLVSPNDHSHDFVETVAKNTGLDVTIFRDRTQAVSHLLRD